MTAEDTSTLEATDDAALVTMVRRGRLHGYSTLFRRHYPSAVNYARRFVGAVDAQDVAQEAFLRVLRAVQDGGGPREEFVAYLLRTVRNLCTDVVRRTREVPVDDVEASGVHEPVGDGVEAGLDRGLVTTAFRTLPQKWQEVLWLTEVEGHAPRSLAGHYQISAGAVAQLSRRAREGLRSAWLQAHLSSAATEPLCVPTRSVLGEYERGLLTAARSARVEEHLQTCQPCAEALAELQTVSRRTRAALLPVFLASGPLLAQGAEWTRSAKLGPGRGLSVGGGAAVAAGGAALAAAGAVDADAPAAGGAGGADDAGAPAGASATAGWWHSLRADRTWWAALIVVTGLVVALVLLVVAPQFAAEDPLAGRLGVRAIESVADDAAAPSSHTDEEEATSGTVQQVDTGSAGALGPVHLGTGVDPAPIPPTPDPPAAAEETAVPEEPEPAEVPPAPAPVPPAPTDPTEPMPTEPEPTEPTEPEPTEPLPPEAPTLDGPPGGEQRQPVALSGTAEPGSTVRVLDSSGTEVATATAAEDGTWSAAPPRRAMSML